MVGQFGYFERIVPESDINLFKGHIYLIHP